MEETTQAEKTIIRKAVFAIADRGEGKKPFWREVGSAFTNRDGSLSLVLDAMPVNGRLHVRDVREPNETRNH